ncbi:MAG: DUF1638 domain-containing protein [Lachnospiraceae bacterium]|nr:DUF1638 domain-containing protein [Lachnospiraceae bacterium]
MSTVVLSCSSLKEFVLAAQAECGTDYPVIFIDRKYHVEPETMKERIEEAVRELPEEVDTVLVAMGFCGGAWDHVSFGRRVVVPKVDDCVSLLLNHEGTFEPNRKETGHLYLYESDPDDFSALRFLRDRDAQEDVFGGMDPEFALRLMLEGYRNMDIIDTGLNDCYSEPYVAAAQEEADRIGADLDYAYGGIGMLKRLFSGEWEEGFLIADPGQLIRHGDFFG